MSLWPFGKKQDTPQHARHAAAKHSQHDVDRAAARTQPHEAAKAFDDHAEAASDATAQQSEASWQPQHQADVDGSDGRGEHGPYDLGEVQFEDFDFTDYSEHTLNLGSLLIPLPKQSQVQVEMGAQGPKMLHILTEHGRLTPVAFAAPASGGQWRRSAQEIAEQMRADGLVVHMEDGPWGREVVGRGEDEQSNVIRIIGVDGPRWMLRVTAITHADLQEQMTDTARALTARTFVERGSTPVLAGEALPVALPTPLAEQVQKEMERRQINNQAHYEQQPPSNTDR